jgi:hypothetical protein
MTKLCKDCRHVDTDDDWFWRCKHPQASTDHQSLLTGYEWTTYRLCSKEREQAGHCGPSGSNWAPAPEPSPKDDFFSWLARFFRFGL